jgi:hypothetical protein
MWYWDHNPLELIAAALFSKPHRHKKAYQEYLKEKILEQS